MESGEIPGESVTVKLPCGDKSDTWKMSSRFCQDQKANDMDRTASALCRGGFLRGSPQPRQPADGIYFSQQAFRFRPPERSAERTNPPRQLRVFS